MAVFTDCQEEGSIVKAFAPASLSVVNLVCLIMLTYLALWVYGKIFFSYLAIFVKLNLSLF